QSGECLNTLESNLTTAVPVAISPDGYFTGKIEDIKEHVRVSEAPLSQRKLTDAEIEHFRKKGNFLELGEIERNVK
ncbi:MAG: hypothetical protein U9N59_07535, partial [Campylobacterota bacterium]|nr:hypothetical protein [Campylobacterota bacterium]